jgi:hypothetical protein
MRTHMKLQADDCNVKHVWSKLAIWLIHALAIHIRKLQSCRNAYCQQM